ncbi:hypothetical protein [uncultured Acetobacteroides sp.]|uniref:hypothetical protein n=1 Tax=uncultured Acetobacteroides sp. TaxID=1760811 RepID=UPI0029F5186A|nr:hypothetical protein [uncultured Acetobacteroides sp.]
MKNIALAALLIFGASALPAQKTFTGSVKFKVSSSKPAHAGYTFDTITYSYYSNGAFVDHRTSSCANFSYPEITVETDSAYFIKYNGSQNQISRQERLNNMVRRATATNEYQTILNHRCQKYVVKQTIKDGVTLTAYWWIAQDLVLKGSYSQMLAENKGCPLKYELLRENDDPAKSYIEVREAVEIRETTQPFDLAGFLKGKPVSPYSLETAKRGLQVNQ